MKQLTEIFPYYIFGSASEIRKLAVVLMVPQDGTKGFNTAITLDYPAVGYWNLWLTESGAKYLEKMVGLINVNLSKEVQ